MTQSICAPARIPLPTEVNWHCVAGIVLHYDRKTAQELVDSGLIVADEIPANRSKSSRNGSLRVCATKDGAYNVRVDADSVLSRDARFKSFLGGILADTRLSLVQGESHE